MTRNMAKGLIAGAVMLALAGCKSDDDVARELLANALQQYSVVQNEALPTADRLVAGREVVAVLDRIVADYGTTDLGLQIAAGGNFGAVSRRDLADQIIDLEMMRENELCDEQPTAGCIVERLALDLGISERPELYQRVNRLEAGMGLWLALASRDTQGAQALMRADLRGAVPAMGVAMAPLEALDDQTIRSALNAFDERTTATAAFVALHRIASGEDHPSLRALVAGYRRVPDLMTLVDPAQSLDQKIAWVNQLEDARTLPMREIDEAGNILSLLNRSTGDGLLFDILLQQHDAAEVMSIFEGDNPDFEFLDDRFGSDYTRSRAALALQDPSSDPRTRSFAVMYAARHFPVDDLRSAIDSLAGQDVMTWDNIRVFSSLIALGYIGDRDLFDAVIQILTPADIRDPLEKTWTAGRALAEGNFDANSDVLSDASLFRATVAAASVRASRDHIERFLMTSAQLVGERPPGYVRGPVGGDDIAQAAYSCGLPAITVHLPELSAGARLNPQACDRARLGTTADLWADEDFAAFLDSGHQIGGPMGRSILVETAHAAPQRAHAFVQTGEGDDRLFATALLAMLLASGPPPG